MKIITSNKVFFYIFQQRIQRSFRKCPHFLFNLLRELKNCKKTKCSKYCGTPCRLYNNLCETLRLCCMDCKMQHYFIESFRKYRMIAQSKGILQWVLFFIFILSLANTQGQIGCMCNSKNLNVEHIYESVCMYVSQADAIFTRITCALRIYSLQYSIGK